MAIDSYENRRNMTASPLPNKACYPAIKKKLDWFDTNHVGEVHTCCYSPFCYLPGTYKLSHYPFTVFF